MPSHLEVQVRDPEGYKEKHCFHLGHHSYRCGNCQKDFVKVRSENDHDKECPRCEWKVVARRTWT